MYKIEKDTWRCWSYYTHRFLSNRPGKRYGRVNWEIRIDGIRTKQQAAVWIALTFPELVAGEWFPGAVIDHIDTDRLNNDPGNLRWCTPKENNNNPLTRLHLSEAKKGRCFTEEHRRKLSEAQKGKHPSEETRRKMSEANRNHPGQSKPVNQYDLDGNYIAWYPSGKEAERQTRESERQRGVSCGSISNCCLGKTKTAGGFRWSYA